MNLQVLKPSRARPQAGDVFAFRPGGVDFMFGRVIRTDAQVGPRIRGLNLIYVYDVRAPSKEVDPAELTPDRLLLPPMMTNALPWVHGYFETIERKPVIDQDRLRGHVFASSNGRFYDDEDHEVPAASGVPIGSYGVHSYQTIDDEISKALGLPVA